MKILVFQGFRLFCGVPPIWGLCLASCWLLAGLLLASWFLLASSSFPTRISVENRFLKRLPKLVNSLHANACFFNNFGVSWVPPPCGASSWPFAGVLLASCWLLAGLLACCWPLAGLPVSSCCWPFLASCWPLAGFPRQSIPLENRFFEGFPKLVNSLHENACFSMVSVFRWVPRIWGLFLASCWLLPGLLLASWFLLENLFFKGLSKLVNSLHENACFSMVSVFRWVPPIWGLCLASCCPLPGFLLASPPEHPARKSVFQRSQNW